MHRIRLRGPWLKTIGPSRESFTTSVPERPTPDSAPAIATGRATSQAAPSSGGGEPAEGMPEGDGVTHYERRFNCPTGLDASTRVHLRLEHWSGQPLQLSVNGHPITLSGPPLEAEITSYLSLHNRIQLTLEPTAAASPALDGEVMLLIQTAAED